MGGECMSELSLYKSIDKMLELVNTISETKLQLNKADEQHYNIYDGKRILVFYGEYAAWCFLAGYALARSGE